MTRWYRSVLVYGFGARTYPVFWFSVSCLLEIVFVSEAAGVTGKPGTKRGVGNLE